MGVYVDPGTLPAGTYRASYQVSADNSTNGPLTETVTLVIGQPPIVQLNPTAVTLTSWFHGPNPAPASVGISNGRIGPLTGLAVSGIAYAAGQPTGWLAASLAATSAPTTLSITGTTGSLAVGTYNATLTIASAAAGASTTLPVTFVVSNGPALALNPSSVSLTAVQGSGGATTSDVTVANAGGGTLGGLAAGTVVYGTGQPTGWLALAFPNGTTGPTTLRVSATVGTLAAGTYTATVPITSSTQGVTNSPQTLAVSFVVSSPLRPTLALSATTVGFEATAGGAAPTPKTVDVTNSGSGALTGLSVGSITYTPANQGNWLAATLSSSSAPATLTLAPTVGTLSPGTYTALVPVASAASGVTNSPQTVRVDLVVRAGPTLALSPATLTFTASAGGANPAPQVVSVRNTGTGSADGLAVSSITYDPGQPNGWLTAALSATSATAEAPAALTVTPMLNALPPGSYGATVAVSSTNAAGSPQTLRVTFTVAGTPTLALAKTALSFTVAVGGPATRAQTVGVTNTGVGTLDRLTVGTIDYGAPGSSSGYITASLGSTVAPTVLTVQATGAAITTPGTFTAVVPVRSPAAGNSPVNLTVTVIAWRLADVTAALRDPSRLTPEQLQQLDTLGNHNGRFDLPDYLALLQRAGLAPAPAIARAP